MEFEYVEPEYDEVEDGYEIRASREDYERESALLLRKINERDELAGLLKLARPEKIADIKKAVAKLDDYIESQEKITEATHEIHQKRREMWKHDMKTLAMADAILPELRKYVAENNPEKLELLEAMLEGKSVNH